MKMPIAKAKPTRKLGPRFLIHSRIFAQHLHISVSPLDFVRIPRSNRQTKISRPAPNTNPFCACTIPIPIYSPMFPTHYYRIIVADTLINVTNFGAYYKLQRRLAWLRLLLESFCQQTRLEIADSFSDIYGAVLTAISGSLSCVVKQ